MCIKYYTSKEVLDQRKRLKDYLDRKIRKNSVEDFDFLVGVELDILEEINISNQEIQDIFEQYKREDKDENWLYLALAGIIRSIYLSVGTYISQTYYRRYNVEPSFTFELLMLPYISQRIPQVIPSIVSNTSKEKVDVGRALTIASTEVRTAQSIAEYLVMRDVNVQKPVKKFWVGVLDDRIRDDHFNAAQFYNKLNAIGFEEYFIVGGELMKYPRDSGASAKNTINCRCYLSYVTI